MPNFNERVMNDFFKKEKGRKGYSDLPTELPNLLDREKYYNKGIDDFIEAILESKYAKAFVCVNTEECSCVTDPKRDVYNEGLYDDWLYCKSRFREDLIRIKEEMK